MPEPIPGGNLEALADALADPLLQIVAHLAQGPIGQQAIPVSLIGLQECTFPGYAPIPLTADLDTAWETDSYGEMGPQRLQFIAGAVVVPQRVSHIYYTYQHDNDAPSLLSCVAFDNPITVDTPGQVLEFDAVLGCLETLG